LTSSSSSSSVGLIAGIVVGILVLCLIFVFVVILIVIRRRNQKKQQNSNQTELTISNANNSVTIHSTPITVTTTTTTNPTPTQYASASEVFNNKSSMQTNEEQSPSNVVAKSTNSNLPIYANATTEKMKQLQPPSYVKTIEKTQERPTNIYASVSEVDQSKSNTKDDVAYNAILMRSSVNRQEPQIYSSVTIGIVSQNMSATTAAQTMLPMYANASEIANRNGIQQQQQQNAIYANNNKK